MRTPMSSTHETCGCSTKNLGTLWVFSIRSWSLLYAMTRLLKGSLEWDRHLSKVERPRRPLARRVGLPQQQLNCHGSSPTEPCASWQRACRRDPARPSPQNDRVPKGAVRWRSVESKWTSEGLHRDRPKRSCPASNDGRDC